MKIAEALTKIKDIKVSASAPPSFNTAARALSRHTGAKFVENSRSNAPEDESGSFRMICTGHGGEQGLNFQIRSDGSGGITAANGGIILGFLSYLTSHLGERDVAAVENGCAFRPAFQWQRSTYDFFLNQEGRVQRGMDREAYFRRLAASGFTHVEINGLAFPMGLESGPKGETYPMFYTYCPALDQFVYSVLNKGLYPYYYLSANLDNLKKNAALALKYGLIPGLLCFEPRSVPEEFFARYPMLRGARVDHPFRSFKPRYNMTITHPKVREHYAEMLTKLLVEVPELDYLSIWTNDSGAGFEYTKSLYVGRNGGAYLIREWNDDNDIARAAGDNALRFFRLLRDTARAINPCFRVITRMESFYGEHEVIWEGLGDHLDVETSSLMAKGWETPYIHPKYPDSKMIHSGSIHQTAFDQREEDLVAGLESKGSHAHFYLATGPNAMFAPLLGIPYPTLSYKRLKTLYDGGVRFLSHLGGTYPEELVPFNVNHEIFGAFQFDPELNINEILFHLAHKWAGPSGAEDLMAAWSLTEEAILAFPNVTPLYSAFGFVWYRLWVRPFVPNIEAIPDAERAYYQDFMCTTPHNPNNIDLSRDVLFQLMTPETCRRSLARIDKHLWKPIDQAISILKANTKRAQDLTNPIPILEDTLVRLEALRCWFMTQRNTAAWVAGVYGYMQAQSEAEKESNRILIKEMITKEIENTNKLLELFKTGIAFMALSGAGETPLIYGSNIEENLGRRVALMRRHIDDEPYIDFQYTEKKAGELQSP
ncbi:MAG: hypothetical protein KJ970_04745 [Candidatus Eisenbacteria bacterium]|uniref:Uncharacterized protein n=1 Tax=Eiseniibacteriota bacterium TaxID=2212470 RepID=A0A948RSJ8_UNCEI|nr:hypothetical protein [Candidatus Eisenbacteria bacterium]